MMSEQKISCRVIAAIDVNHNGELALAKRLVDAAINAGAHAVKFQKRNIEMAGVRQLLNRPLIKFPSLGGTYREVKERLELPIEAVARLYEHAGSAIDFVMAPYDIYALGELEALPKNVSLKIDPPCAVNIPLLEAIADRGGEVAAAVGACTTKEIVELVNILGECRLTLVQSTCSLNINMAEIICMKWLRRFGRPVGYSDDGPALDMALAAVAGGAEIIEKRLTLDRKMAGPNHGKSLVPDELEQLVKLIRALEYESLDAMPRRPNSEELDEMEDERPSIVTACPIPKGTKLSRHMLTVKPPYKGLSPRLIPFLIGKRVLYDMDEDEYLTFGVVE